MKRDSIAPFVTLLVLGLTIVAPWSGSYGPTSIATRQIIEPTTITIDGLADDWQGYQPLIVDDRGDGDAVDVKSVYGLTNDQYLYLMIEVYGVIGRYSHIDVLFDFEGDGMWEYLVSFTPFLGTVSHYDGYIHLNRPDGEESARLLGTLSAQYQVVEFRMPLEFMEGRQDFYAMVNVSDTSTGTPRVDDDTSWGHVAYAEQREPDDGERTGKMRAAVLIAAILSA